MKEKENIDKKPAIPTKKTTRKKTSVSTSKYKGLQNKLLHIKVGTATEPASDEQIKEIEDKVIDLLKRNDINCLAFVTHHAVEIKIIGDQEGVSKNEKLDNI